MGTWSTDSFGNDTACDWSYELEETKDLELIRATVQNALQVGEDYLEAPTAEEAIAAIEVIARLKGSWGERNSYTEAADKWVKAHAQRVPPELVSAAIETLDRILTPPSELLELWQDSEEFEAWKSAVADLKERVRK
jgi:hypothetical protein